MKSINQQAPVKCTRSVFINANSQKIWEVLTQINNWAQWQTDISKPVLKGALMPGASFTWRTGGVGISSVLHTVEPFQRFGWTGKTFGAAAIHNWFIIAHEGNTEVRVEESMEGWLAKIFRKSFNNNLATGMQRWLELLKATCEQEAGPSYNAAKR